MSKKELAKVESNDALAVDEELSTTELLKAFNLNPEKWIDVSGGSQYYWPAIKGAAVHGVLTSTFNLEKAKGAKFDATYYVMSLLHEASAIENSTQEQVNLEAGEKILILARNALKRDLEPMLGKEVIIMCTGQIKTKNGFDMYTYKVVTPK